MPAPVDGGILSQQPHHGCGSAALYEALIAFAQRNDILVLHDNAYSELTFNGQRCGSFPRISRRQGSRG